MRGYAIVCIALIGIAQPAVADEGLVGNTLVCEAVGGHGWRSMTYIHVTATHMFKQDATKETRTGRINAGGSATGAVYQWNKRNSGSAGVVSFRTYATKGVGKLSYETRYRVPNTLSDNVTMNVVEQGQAELQGSNWVLVVDRKQSSPNGPVTVPNHRETYRCQLKGGRHLR